jgi:outer membrane receptor for ferrienterochelin and colicin
LKEGANIGDVGGAAARFAMVGVNMQDGFYFTEKLKEQNLEAEMIFTLPKIASNEIVAGVGVRYAKILQDDYTNSIENGITQNLSTILASPNYNSFRYNEIREPAFWANPTVSFIRANQSRTIGYGYVQDLISVNRDVDFILGARIDNYSDIGKTQLSQRAAVVYRANDTTIFKLLYGSAFRAPTFTEAYANGHINYRAGVEFEYNFKSKLQHNLYFNASYIQTGYATPPEEDYPVSTNQSMPDISKIMFKALYIYKPVDNLSFGTAWKYFSKTTQSQIGWIIDDGTDTTVHPQHIVDETLTYKLSSSSEFRVTVKNIFNADIRESSYYYNTDGGIKREGRNYLVGYVKSF